MFAFPTAYLPDNLGEVAGLQTSDLPYAKWFVNELYRKANFRGRRPDRFFPISSETAERIYPTRVWPRIRAALTAAGILECDGKFTPGKKSLGYRLAEAYATAGCVAVRIESRELSRKVMANRAEPQGAYAGILNTAKRLRVAEKPRLINDFGTVSILAGDIWWVVCRYGRLHYPLTNLRKENRSSLRLDGEGLWQVDTRNSQPLYLALLLRKWLRLFSRDTSSLNPHSTIPHHHTPSLPPPPFLQPYLEEIQNDEVKALISLTSSGDLYGAVAAGTGLSKKEVKPAVFGVLYGRGDAADTPAGEYLLRKYPTIVKAITRMNRANRGGLAKCMQRAEASVIIGGAAGRYAAACGSHPLTVHDSLAVPLSRTDEAVAAMTAAFRRAFGLVPPLRMEPF